MISVTVAEIAWGICKGLRRSFGAISTTAFVIFWTFLGILTYFFRSLEPGVATIRRISTIIQTPSWRPYSGFARQYAENRRSADP